MKADSMTLMLYFSLTYLAVCLLCRVSNLNIHCIFSVSISLIVGCDLQRNILPRTNIALSLAGYVFLIFIVGAYGKATLCVRCNMISHCDVRVESEQAHLSESFCVHCSPSSSAHHFGSSYVFCADIVTSLLHCYWWDGNIYCMSNNVELTCPVLSLLRLACTALTECRTFL